MKNRLPTIGSGWRWNGEHTAVPAGFFRSHYWTDYLADIIREKGGWSFQRTLVKGGLLMKSCFFGSGLHEMLSSLCGFENS